MSKQLYPFLLGDTQVSYALWRKAVKRITLRVRRDGTLHLTVPTHTPVAEIERILLEKADWIIENRQRMLARAEKPFSLQEGDTLPLYGVSHTVTVLFGEKAKAERRDGKLILILPQPDDAQARLALVRDFVSREAKAYLAHRLQTISPLFLPIPPTAPKLTVRWMRTRWGSCTSARGHITLNSKLLFVLPALADFVICHELCHFRYPDHSPLFYGHLARFVPDHVAALAALRATPIPRLYDT